MHASDGPRVALALLSALALGMGVLAAVSPGAVYDAGYLTVVSGAAALAWWGSLRRTGLARLLGRLVAVALATTALGDLVWYVYYWTSGEPDVSWADPPYLLSYLFLGAALVVVLMRTQRAHLRLELSLIHI